MGFLNKYIMGFFGVSIIIISGFFYVYYNNSQAEMVILNSNINELKAQKKYATDQLDKQTKEVLKITEEIKKQNLIITEIEKQNFLIREESNKLKLKIEKRDFDSIVKSSESRKMKVKTAIEDSTYKKLSNLEDITKKIKELEK